MFCAVSCKDQGDFSDNISAAGDATKTFLVLFVWFGTKTTAIQIKNVQRTMETSCSVYVSFCFPA